MKIATWNVNSIKARLEPALAWLKAAKPDVVALQEIKRVDEKFPREAFESLGYNCAVHGQKTYNGVAILSKRPMEDVTPRLPGGDGDDHARYLEAVITGEARHRAGGLDLCAQRQSASGTDKFDLQTRLAGAAASGTPRALLGARGTRGADGRLQCHPRRQGCREPESLAEGRPVPAREPSAALRRIENLGYTDAFRALHPEGGHYTFWDY